VQVKLQCRCSEEKGPPRVVRAQRETGAAKAMAGGVKAQGRCSVIDLAEFRALSVWLADGPAWNLSAAFRSTLPRGE
jgi:hypothetical protein